MKKFAVILAAIVGGILIGLYMQPLISEDNIYQQINKFKDVLLNASKNYVEEVDTQKLVEAAIRGMLNQLDPHSVYIPADEMKQVNEDFQGSFDGIGVQFTILNDTITVEQPVPGGPSDLLGIQSGDKIVKINDTSAIGIINADVQKKLKGPKGTKVSVDIFRKGTSGLLHYIITRDKIPLLSVENYFIIDGTDIGVVQIGRFSATTHREMMDALNELKTKGMKKLILDLRNNPGGYLNQAYLVADEFVPGGDTIVYTKGRRSEFDEVYIGANGGDYEDIPLIVMINSGSASASEIVSGAIQDLDRGLIVGTTSFGKGLVQRQFTCNDGSAYRLTISRYYTPSGRCIQRPYNDKDRYRHLAGRLDLEECSYINYPIKKISEQVDKMNKGKVEGKDKDYMDFDSLPLFKTKRGRIVFGDGGITPDYIVKPDTNNYNKLFFDIIGKNLFFEFDNDYIHGKGSSLKEKYQINFLDFLRNWDVPDDMMNDFKKLVESQGVVWDDKLYKQSQDIIKIYIKGYLARIIWNNNRATQVFSTIDNQLTKAAELFPDAEKIMKMR
jgi:carboxyl-terminal processing protease